MNSKGNRTCSRKVKNEIDINNKFNVFKQNFFVMHYILFIIYEIAMLTRVTFGDIYIDLVKSISGQKTL